jgi:hypothetical protein
MSVQFCLLYLTLKDEVQSGSAGGLLRSILRHFSSVSLLSVVK